MTIQECIARLRGVKILTESMRFMTYGDEHIAASCFPELVAVVEAAANLNSYAGDKSLSSALTALVDKMEHV